MARTWTVALFDLESWEAGYFRKYLPSSRFTLLTEERPLAAKDATRLSKVHVLSVFITSKVPAPLFAKLPALRLITTRSTGYDHIDTAAARRLGVAVANVPYYGENTVAEHAFALLLALTRKVHIAYDRTIRGDFSREGLRGIDLQGRTIGVVGCGNIGQHVLRIAKGFGMRALVFDPGKGAAAIARLGGKKVTLDALIRQSDVVTLHAPLLPQTRHLINKRNVRHFKRGSILINTARGGLVETDALFLALQRGWIDMAGLDVLEEEEGTIMEEAQLLASSFKPRHMRTVLENHLLLHRSDVLITPHNAFNSQEAVERILATTVENILSFTRNRPRNLVTK